MTLQEAFNHLLTNWDSMPADFRNKYRYYKSVNKTGTRSVTESKMREMLINSGYKENWKK